MSEIRVLVGTTDFDGATAFYGDVLGFPVQEHWDIPTAAARSSAARARV